MPCVIILQKIAWPPFVSNCVSYVIGTNTVVFFVYSNDNMLLCAQIKLTWTSEESKSRSVDRYFMWSCGWIVSYHLQQCSFSSFVTNMHLYKYILRLFKYNPDIGVHLYSSSDTCCPAGLRRSAAGPVTIFHFFLLWKILLLQMMSLHLFSGCIGLQFLSFDQR